MAEVSLPSPADSRDGRRFLLDLDRRLERFDRAILVADWNLYSGRSRSGASEWQLKRAALLSDPRLLPWVRESLRRSWPSLLHRRLELMERILLDSYVEQSSEVVRIRSDLQRRIVAFRPRWKGRRVNRAVVHRVLWESKSERERRQAYYCFELLHRPLEEPLRRLVRLRNERARELGARSYAHLRLGFQGFSPERLDAWTETAVAEAPRRIRALRESFQAATGQSGWHPWDFYYAHHRRVPLPDRSFPQRGMLPRILSAVGEWGFPIDRMRFRVVYHDLPSGGLTLAPDPPRDVRILVHPQSGWRSHLVMFHEVGHAVQSSCIRAPRHLLRWHENVPGFSAFHEGIGALFEELASNEEWLARRPGISRSRAADFARMSRSANVLEAVSHAGWFGVEQSLYRRPETDAVADGYRYVRRLCGYDSYEPRSFVDSFFIDEPIYAPNYLVASLFAQHLAATLKDRFSGPFWPNRRVGPWLTRNWFAPGSIYDWVPRVKTVTGRPFSADAFRRAARAAS
jgi:hypothetical protein